MERINQRLELSNKQTDSDFQIRLETNEKLAQTIRAEIENEAGIYDEKRL